MRSLLLLTAASLLVTPVHAETVTVLKAPEIVIGDFTPPAPGAKTLHLTVGFGSALFRDPKAPAGTVFGLADRGANLTCDDAKDVYGVEPEVACPALGGLKAGEGRLYPSPDYQIAIYELKLDPAAKTFAVTRTIPLKTPAGKPVSGLLNPLKVAKTEKGRDGAGRPLPADPNAIDAEGLVRLPDGRFFVSEENATGIVEVSADGTITRRFVPAGTEGDYAAADYPVVGSLPAILAKRNSNRGLESLALSEDGRFLYTLVQNPLANPDGKTYNGAVNTRLLKIEIGKAADGMTTLIPVAEFVYQLDDWQAFKALGATDATKPSSLRISEMLHLGNEHFAVDERTDQIAKIFEISLQGATNILGTLWDDAATTPSLEQTKDLAAAKIAPVTKVERLVASSLGDKAAYPAKIEGMALDAEGSLVLINDNDFGITGEETRVLIVKDSGIGPRS